MFTVAVIELESQLFIEVTHSVIVTVVLLLFMV